MVILFSEKHSLKFGNEIQKTQRQRGETGYKKDNMKTEILRNAVKILFSCKMCNEMNIVGHRTFYQSNMQGVKNSVAQSPEASLFCEMTSRNEGVM